jgi:L-ribulose-5-phosphate 4-epimerase
VLLAELREQVVEAGLEALHLGIVYGTAGNFSVREPGTGLIAISPSGMPYPSIMPADIAIVNQDGEIQDGERRPSSETPMHTMIYRQRPDIGAIVHTHSHYSTVVSTIRTELPPILTEVCIVVGERVPVTRYGLTGTDDIGLSVLEAMEVDTKAVILKNHGLNSYGKTIAEALSVATIVEESARVYIHALAANGGREPNLVNAALIPGMQARFAASYGQPK